MGIELVVLDFDGTLTEVDQEVVPFVDAYKKDVAVDLETSRDELEKRWSAAQSRIESNPSHYGWLMNGKIIAPAYADPLVMSRTIADLLLNDAGLHMDEEVRSKTLDGYFQANYGKLRTVFKDDADKFLTTLRKNFGVCIVTNSRTNGVAKKIQQLPTDHTEVPVHGDAKKYVLQPDWSEVPESIEREGFGRPLFLRRQQYWNVLQQIMEERDVTPERVAVVGDIYELDLLLPEYRGMHVVLISRDSTPKFEVEAVKSSSIGYVARNLENALGHIIYES